MRDRVQSGFRAAFVALLVVTLGQTVPLEAAEARVTLRPDGAFATDGLRLFEGWQEASTVHPGHDGRSLVVLKRRSSEGVVVETGVVRLLADGSTDPSFATAAETPGLIRIAGDRSVVVLRDGSFMLDTRRFTQAGEPDVSFGLNGYIAVDGEEPVALGGSYLALFELGDGSLGMVRSGCYVDHIPTDGFMELPVALDLACDVARVTLLPDGRTALVVAHGVDVHVVALTAGGAVTSVGDVPQEFASACTPVIAAAAGSASTVLVLAGSSSTQLCALGLDGGIDTSFGSSGFVPIDGVANAVHSDARGVMVSVPYTFHLRPGAPYAPAVLKLTANGHVESAFGTSAAPGWLDVIDLGISQPALAGQIVMGSDGSAWFPLGISTGTGSNSVVDPVAALLRAVAVTVHPIDTPADVSRPATRQHNAHTVG